jgi:site-specific DNA-methyltransferase (adenine-specific)
MIPTLTIGDATIYQGNNLHILPELADNSVDAIVCDPPYELGFMGKSWDSSGIAYSVELWQECLRVLKPGGHLLAFGGTRTWHRLAVAIEDAGFEIRDNIAWLYGSGFPKSHNISKAIDKLHGAEREVVGINEVYLSKRKAEIEREQNGGVSNLTQSNLDRGGDFYKSASSAGYNNTADGVYITAPATDEAKAWDGWGTALKPAHEPIVVARKPVEGTVAANVLTYGTGALNIDATRIGTEVISVHNAPKGTFAGGDAERGSDTDSYRQHEGRWPANIILDEFTAELLDEQTATLKGAKTYVRATDATGTTNINLPRTAGTEQAAYGDTGGASRFFYVAKANKRDRNEGLDELPEQILTGRDEGQDDRQVPFKTRSNVVKNIHPTVKPTALMQYLIRLVTPEGGVVLDPFAGSGSTGKAAILEGKRFIGIELTADYLPIIEGRLQHAVETMNNQEGDLFE